MGLKIAFVYDVVYPWVKGGVEKRIYELARRLAREHEVHVYGYKLWEGRDEIEREGIFYRGTVKVDLSGLYVSGRRSLLPPLLHSLKLPALMKGERFDVVDCQASPYLPSYSLRLLDMKNVLITWHEFWGDYWLEYLGSAGSLARGVERGLFSFKRHIAVSRKTELDLLEAGLRKPISVVPNGIDLKLVKEVRPADLESDFIFVGRLIREKGVGDLIGALARIKPELPDFRAVIVGDGPERAHLERLVTEMSLEENVIFTGFLGEYSDVIALMKSSKVFAFPSRREGFGMVVLEAMASGIPVVTSDHPMNASRFLVEDGKTGFVVNTGKLPGTLLMALERWKRMGRFASRCAGAYDWDRIVEELLNVYGVVQ